MSEMAEFIEQVAISQYTHGIYATTSTSTLWISQTPEFEIGKNTLRIEFINNKFAFIYKESPYLNREWRKEADEQNSFSTFEYVIKRLKWFLK